MLEKGECFVGGVVEKEPLQHLAACGKYADENASLQLVAADENEDDLCCSLSRYLHHIQNVSVGSMCRLCRAHFNQAR